MRCSTRRNVLLLAILPAATNGLSPSPSPTQILAVAKSAAMEASALISSRVGAAVVKTKSNTKDLLTEVDSECQAIIARHILTAFPSGHALLGEEDVPPGKEAAVEVLEQQLSGDATYLWIVDPLDGTTNFVQGLPMCGVSIGVARRRPGESTDCAEWELLAGVIADPFKDELFVASAGGGATLNGERLSVGSERLGDAVVATGFAPNERCLRPMVRGISAVGARARTVRMLGSAAIMLAWVACGRLSAYFEADLNAWDTAAGVLLVREAGGVVTDLRGDPFEITTRPIIACNAVAHAELRDVLAEAGVTGLDDV